MTIMARTVRMDTKRRPTLPSDLLEAAGIAVGEDLVASTNGDGSVVLRSRSSSLRQIREEISAGFGPLTEASSLRDDRATDDAVLNRRMETVSENPDAVGAGLLDRLGL